MTNEQKAAILDDEAMWKEKIAHIAAQGEDNGMDRSEDLMARAALLRECAAMMRERSTVVWHEEGGATKNGLYLWAGPVVNGFASLVQRGRRRLHLDWHPTLEAAQAAAVAWVDEQEGRDA